MAGLFPMQDKSGIVVRRRLGAKVHSAPTGFQ